MAEKWLEARAVQAAFLLALAGIWQLVAMSNYWPSYIFPSPAGVAESLYSGLGDGSFVIGVSASLKRMLIGYGLSLFLGVSIGLGLGRVRILRETFGSVATGVQAIPSIAWLPLAILWFGLNESAIIFVVVMGALFSIAISTESGVRSIPPIFMKAARNMGAKGAKLYADVILPAALPSIAAGMKQGWGFAWRSLMAGELIFGSTGLGMLLNMGRELNDINRVVAVMFVIMLVGLAADKLVFGALEDSVRRKWGLSHVE
jgi:NitT/TauT family transport system permease protein